MKVGGRETAATLGHRGRGDARAIPKKHTRASATNPAAPATCVLRVSPSLFGSTCARPLRCPLRAKLVRYLYF